MSGHVVGIWPLLKEGRSLSSSYHMETCLPGGTVVEPADTCCNWFPDQGLPNLQRLCRVSTYDGDLRDPPWWRQERPVPLRVARGPLGGLSCFLSRRCRGLRSCVEPVPEPEDSSPVLTWILGYFWSLPRGVSSSLGLGHARALSSRAVAAVSRFPSRGSRDQGLYLEALPRGFPSRLFHRAVPRATVV